MGEAAWRTISAARRCPVSEGQGLLNVGDRSVLGSIVAAPLARGPVPGIDPAISVLSARAGHALVVAGILAIARITIYAPWQAVGIRCALISPGLVYGGICLSPGLPAC